MDTLDPENPRDWRALRLQAGLSLQNVADALACTRAAISYWENGRSRPDPERRVAYTSLLRDLQRLALRRGGGK